MAIRLHPFPEDIPREGDEVGDQEADPKSILSHAQVPDNGSYSNTARIAFESHLELNHILNTRHVEFKRHNFGGTQRHEN
jgi:hypothetical protein